MAHALTIACVEKAEKLLRNDDLDSFRYASLQLRMAIEYLFYELVSLYKDELPADILTTTWKPQQILAAILECDPDASKDTRMVFAPSGMLGNPDAPHLVLESKAPTKALLSAHWHRLGSYLHAPVTLVEPDLTSWREALANTLTSLREYKPQQALENIKDFIEVECAFCGKLIKRNRQRVIDTGFVKCLNPDCRGITDVRFDDGLEHFLPRQNGYDCPHCETRSYYPEGTFKDNLVLKCVECHKKVFLRQRFEIIPLDVAAKPAGEMTLAEIFDLKASIGNGVLKGINETQKPTNVVRAINLLMGRLVDSGNTLRSLYDHANHHSWALDGASILRTSYDAMLQVLYILHDEKLSDELATRFLDFKIVERVKLLNIFVGQSTTFSRRLAQSPLRAENEAQIQAEFLRVCQKYDYDSSKPQKIKNWYQGNLDSLADKTGYLAEYKIVQKQLSSVVHSSIFGIDSSDYLKPLHVMRFQADFAFRVLGALAAHVNVKLNATESEFFKLATRNIYDSPDLEPKSQTDP